MFTALYAALSGLLICWLALQVIKVRRRHKIAFSDGEIQALTVARSAHSNATENLPIFLIMLFLLEYNGAHILLINLLGIVMISGRIIHARGILKEELKSRVLGMKITFFTQIGLALLNIVYLLVAQLSTS